MKPQLTLLGWRDVEGIKWDTSQTGQTGQLPKSRKRFPQQNAHPNATSNILATLKSDGLPFPQLREWTLWSHNCPGSKYLPGLNLTGSSSPASALAHSPCCHTSAPVTAGEMRWPQGCPAARSHPASGASTVCLEVALTGYSQLSGWALVERALVRITRVTTVKTVKRYQKWLRTIGNIKERREAAVACQSKQNPMNPCANSIDHT